MYTWKMSVYPRIWHEYTKLLPVKTQTKIRYKLYYQSNNIRVYGQHKIYLISFVNIFFQQLDFLVQFTTDGCQATADQVSYLTSGR